MSEKLLSFIVPVYNVEEYLRECVESLMRTMDDEYEIILVDDGSTDSSGIICDEYAARYNNITAVHKENGGLSSARNTGLQQAVGKYIAFVDSDDRIAATAITHILKWAQQTHVDICFMQAIKFYPGGTSVDLGDMISHGDIAIKCKREVMAYLASRPKYPGSACTKLFRRQFLDEQDIRFPADRRYSEDLGYVMDCLIKAETFDALDIPYYEYRQNREGSITHSVSKKSFVDLELFVDEAISKLTVERKPITDTARSAMSFAAYEYSILLWRYNCLDKAYQPEALAYLKDKQWVIRFGKTHKLRVISLIIKVFGLRMSSRIIDIYMKYK